MIQTYIHGNMGLHLSVRGKNLSQKHTSINCDILKSKVLQSLWAKNQWLIAQPADNKNHKFRENREVSLVFSGIDGQVTMCFL